MLHTGPPPPPPLPAPASCARARLALRAVAFCAAAPRACTVRRSAVRAPPAERAPLRAAGSRSRTLALAPPRTSRFAGGDMAAGRPARGRPPMLRQLRTSSAATAAAAAASLVLRPRAARFAFCAAALRGSSARAAMAGERGPCAAPRSAWLCARTVHRSELRSPCRRLALTHASNGTPARPTHLSIRSLAGCDMAAGRPARGGDSGSAVGAGVGRRGVG